MVCMIRNHGKDQEAELTEKADLEREAADESACAGDEYLIHNSDAKVKNNCE